MKTLSVALLSVAALAAPAAVLAASFEGTVSFKFTDPSGESHELTQHIKAGLVRMDLSAKGHSASVIMDMNKREMTMLMPQQHMYMVHAMPNPAEAAGPDQERSETTLEKTAVTEKILGYTATKYIVHDQREQTTTDLWLTEELGQFAGLGSGPGPMGMGRRAHPPKAEWEKALAGKDFFPLRVISHDAGGAEKFRMDVVAVSRESQPDSLFTPPEDYQKFDLGGMMPGMGGMPRDN